MERSKPLPPLITAFSEEEYHLEMRRSVREGMMQRQKTIPCVYLYDERGSRLFTRICSLPEYYPARTEMMILEEHAPSIMKFFRYGPGDMVDMGSGSDMKIRMLLRTAHPFSAGHLRYIPVDISPEGLAQSTTGLIDDFPGLEVTGIVGDFARSLGCLPPGRKLICFFGSTLGNFSPNEAVTLLGRFARAMNPGDSLLVGMDMIKPADIMEAAYNDSSGITARFNLNILRHVNEKLHADFDPACFRHLAFFDPDKGQIEMHLEAKNDLGINIADLGLKVRMKRGETIRTEISRKFRRAQACALFSRAGFVVENWYADERGWFSLAELKPVARA